MKTYVRYQQDGQIISVVVTSRPAMFGLCDGCLVLGADAQVDPETHYVRDGDVANKGPRPTVRSVFDYRLREWIEPELSKDSLDSAGAKARLMRNELLAASDWTQLPDAPVDQDAWAAYRQALRDVARQPGFPVDITWPVRPT